MIRRFPRTASFAVITVLGLGCAAHDSDLEDPELNAERQAFVNAINGLRTINGLSTRNGLKSINGLSTRNGLRVMNGLTSINGLRTMNGLRTFNGLSVDCSDKELGVECTGTPDGLLSATTGMMRSDDGINTAKYVVRCALPKGDSVRVKDYTGALVTLDGEIGLAPEWGDGDCNGTCQEQVSACLMALTNGSGKHVNVELASLDGAIGGGHTYRYQEAVFYGNLFLDTPAANFCVGKDYAGTTVLLAGLTLGSVQVRACEAYYSLFGRGNCPYVDTGSCNRQLLDLFGMSSNKCSFSGDTASACAAKGSSSKVWKNPITTYMPTR
jgi:hypothetical protein